jgi:hypothetical protein
MALDLTGGGLGSGWASPVPVDPILAGHQEYIPPLSTPTVGIDIGAATAYRGYYYEIVRNLDGNWLWAVYIGTRVSWGLSGVLISGGTSATQAEALAQVTTIIDNLSEDADYVAPEIQEDAFIGLGGVPEPDLGGIFGTPTDTDYAGVMTTPENGNGNGGNGNGGAPLFEDYQFIGLVAIIAAVMLFKKQG